ncbi:MAG: flagellar hook-length control protein FliK [Bdellovibrionaceae bacterium]|nr:flagellar hook-length control protein FliK [Bdellovibrio sp.]
MLEKMISVGPPQKGVTPESKLENKKDFRESSDAKAEFDKTLKEKMLLNKEAAKQSEKNKQKPESSESNQAKDARKEDKDLVAAKKEKKSSGGIKRKMTEDNDDKMISNIMASTESEIEIPESKIDLAEIEVGINKVAENQAGNAEIKAAGAQSNQSAEQLVKGPAQVEGQKVDQQLEANSKLQAQALANLELSIQASSAPVPEEVSEMPAVEMPEQKIQASASPADYDQQMVSRLEQQLKAAQTPASPAQDAATSAAEMEKQLGAAVGFQPDAQKQMSGTELLQKMKSFEADKNIAPEKALAFEQSVLDQLKKQMAQPVGHEQSSSQFESKDENAKEALKDLKLGALKNDGPQHAGQSHTDFKTSFAAPTDKAAEAQANKLEANHDKNIQEIMSQAKFLVTKGGGEMKVTMSPEGMGEVQLKVLLQDGKVNIEIQTQDKSVKKMIEDSLSELKSGLAAHRLSVEHVRIETVNATNTDNNAGFQSNLNQGGSEGKQREFWNQFQQNLGQQPGGRATYGTDKSVGGAGTSGATLTNDAATSAAVRTYGGTKGATVNRVA